MSKGLLFADILMRRRLPLKGARLVCHKVLIHRYDMNEYIKTLRTASVILGGIGDHMLENNGGEHAYL